MEQIRLIVPRKSWDEVRDAMAKVWPHLQHQRHGDLPMDGVSLTFIECDPAWDDDASPFTVEQWRRLCENVELRAEPHITVGRQARELIGEHTLAPRHLQPLLEIWTSREFKHCLHLAELIRRTPKHDEVTTLRELQEWGLIEEATLRNGETLRVETLNYEPHGWRVTLKGKAYIEALLATPLPVQRWVMP